MGFGSSFGFRAGLRTSLFVGLLLSASWSFGVTFTINSTADTADATLGDGICADVTGACTLRAAIEEANALAGGDDIVLPAGTYTRSINSQLSITDDLTITGVGAASIVDANNMQRGFRITQGTVVEMDSFVIRNGSEPFGSGGGISNDRGTLTLTDMEVSNNTAGEGAGIMNDRGTLTILRSLIAGNRGTMGPMGSNGGGLLVRDAPNTMISLSVFQNNEAGLEGQGGAIAIDSPGGILTMEDSTIRDNEAGQGDALGPGDGGGIAILNGEARLIRCSIIDNQAGGDPLIPSAIPDGGSGGGVSNKDTLYMENCTVTGNKAGDGGSDGAIGGAGGNGGGVYIAAGSTSSTIIHSTIVFNEAGAPGVDDFGIPGTPGQAGGIFPDGPLSLGHSIVEANIHAAPGFDDIDDPFGNSMSLGWNIVPDGMWGSGPSDKITPANVLPLVPDPQGADQGPAWNVTTKTLVHPITTASAAYNCGDPAITGAPATDERLAQRIDLGQIDIGAFEIVGSIVDLSLAKTMPVCAQPGEVFDVVIVVSNAGPSAASCLTVTDMLVAPLSFVTNAASPCVATGSVVSCAVAGLGSGASVPVTFSVMVDPTAAVGTYINSADVLLGGCNPQIMETNTANNSTSTTYEVCRPNLAIVKTVNAPTQMVGNVVTYTVAVTNQSAFPALNVEVWDTLPTDLSYVSGPAFCTNVTLVPPANQIQCALGVVPANSTTSFTFQVLLDPASTATTIVNTASVGQVSSNMLVDGDGVMNESSVPFDIFILAVDLSITKVPIGETRIGEVQQFELIVSNAGPSAAQNVMVTDHFDPLYYTTGPQTVNLGTLPAGVSTSVFVSAILNRTIGLDYCGFANRATVTNDVMDVNPANNEVVVPLDVVSVVDLSTSLNAPFSINPGASFNVNLTVRNFDDGVAYGLVVTSTIPVGLAFLGSSCGATQVNNTVVWRPDPLGRFASRTCGLQYQSVTCCPTGTTVTISSLVSIDPSSVTNCVEVRDDTTIFPRSDTVRYNANTISVSLGTNEAYGCNITPPAAEVSASVVCGGLSTSLVEVVTTNGCSVTLLRTAMVENDCGAMEMATQVVTWTSDVIPPVLSLGPDQDIGCNIAIPPSPMLTVTDFCSVVTSDVSTVIETNDCRVTMTHSAFAIDGCGNVGVVTQLITWTLDTEPPVAGLAPDVFLGCNPAVIPPPAISFTDNCGFETGRVTEVQSTNGCTVTLLRSLVVEDPCGNSGFANQILTWSIDTEAPLVSLEPDAFLGCTPPVISAPVLTSSDNCEVANTDFSTALTTNGCLLTLVRTAIAVDACGNVGAATQVLTWVEDTEAPLVSLEQDVQLGCNPPAIPAAVLTTSDNCDVVSSGVTELTTTNGCTVTLIRSAFAEDACGNVGTDSQVLSWSNDTEAPTVSLGPDAVLGCNPLSLPPPSSSSSDNCGVATSDLRTTITTNGCTVTMIRLLVAEDNCNNVGMATQTLVWTSDLDAPEVRLEADMDLGCNPVSIPAPVLDVADACNVATSGISVVVTTNGCLVTMTRSAMAEDGCGNVGTTSQVLTWNIDTEVPVVSLGPDMDLGCNPGTLPPPMDSATDNCGVATRSLNSTTTTNGCTVTMVRVFVAADVCDNVGSATQTLTWTRDTDAPVVSLGADMDLGCSPTNIPAPVLSVSDPCIVTTSDVSVVVSTNGCVVTMTRSAVAEDSCGNVGTGSQVLTWSIDTAAPLLQCGTNEVVVMASAQGVLVSASELGLSASDQCGNLTTNISPDRFNCDDVGTNVVFVEVVDVCGNTATCMVPVVVLPCDTNMASALVLDVVVDDPGCFCAFGPGSFTISITNNGPVALTNVVVNDPLYPACGTNLAVLGVGSSLVYMCEVTLTGTVNEVFAQGFANGETATAMKTVTYAFDTTPPMVTACPEDLVIACDGVAPGPDTNALQFVEDCPASVVVSVTSQALVSCWGEGVAYYYEIVDGCGNRSTCTQNIFIAQPAGPVVGAVSPGRTLACDEPLPAPEQPTVMAPCSTATLAIATNALPASCAALNGVEYVYTAEDGCGGSASVTQQFTYVADFGPPRLSSLPNGAILPCRGVDVPSALSLMAFSDCANTELPVTVVTEVLPANCSGREGTRYIYSATDRCGQVVTHAQDYIFADGVAPDLVCGVDQTVVITNGICSVMVPAVTHTVSDNCSSVNVTQSPAAGALHDTSQNPELLITITAVDGCGNESQCSVRYSYQCSVRIAGTIWFDLAVDQTPDNDELSSLGLTNTTVNLTDTNGNVIATTTTDGQGGFSFDVPPGMYELEFDDSMLPDNQEFTIRPGAIDATAGNVAAANIGLAVAPTAIELVRFEATLSGDGVAIRWSTAWEEDTLGFRVWRGNANGPIAALDEFVLAGSGGANHYELRDADVSSHYWLEEIDTDLAGTFRASAWTAIPSPPTQPGSPADLTVQSVDGEAEVTMASEANVLAIGFATEPSVTDLASGLQRTGAILKTDAGYGIYLRLPDDAQVLIAE